MGCVGAELKWLLLPLKQESRSRAKERWGKAAQLTCRAIIRSAQNWRQEVSPLVGSWSGWQVAGGGCKSRYDKASMCLGLFFLKEHERTKTCQPTLE